MHAPDCPLCQKLAALDRLPAPDVVWQFPHSVALLGPWQFYRGYCLLIARTHARELSGLADDERRAYLEEMCLLAAAMLKVQPPITVAMPGRWPNSVGMPTAPHTFLPCVQLMPPMLGPSQTAGIQLQAMAIAYSW